MKPEVQSCTHSACVSVSTKLCRSQESEAQVKGLSDRIGNSNGMTRLSCEGGEASEFFFLSKFCKDGADSLFPLEIVSSPCSKQTLVAMVSDLALGLAVTALTGHLKRALCMHFDHCSHVKAGLF